jgi:hypothetical protein
MIIHHLYPGTILLSLWEFFPLSSQVIRLPLASDSKEVWDFLQQRYASADFAHRYQLMRDLYNMRQEPGQSIGDFFSKMSYLWDQLAMSEPQWDCIGDTKKFVDYRDSMRLTQFLMALRMSFSLPELLSYLT